MALSIAQFVRENPYANAARLHRVLDLPWDRRLGLDCIELAEDFAAQLEGVKTRMWLPADNANHMAIATGIGEGNWYWDPSLQQAEPLDLNRVWAGQFADCKAFPFIAGRWSLLRFAPLEGRSFSVSKHVFDSERKAPVQKIHYRYEEKDFGKPPASDEKLLDEETHFCWRVVLNDGSTISIQQPEAQPLFVTKHGPLEMSQEFAVGDLTILNHFLESRGLDAAGLVGLMKELPDLHAALRYLNQM